MGRNPKHRDRCLSRVRLPGELVDRLDASLSERESRADALEEAVRREVERREVLQVMRRCTRLPIHREQTISVPIDVWECDLMGQVKPGEEPRFKYVDCFGDTWTAAPASVTYDVGTGRVEVVLYEVPADEPT